MKPWSTSEDNTLKYLWALDMTGDQIAERIFGRTPMSVLARARYIGLARRPSLNNEWTKHKDQTLTEMWMRGDTVGEMAQAMCRSYQGIINRARRLKLPRRRDDKEWAAKAREAARGFSLSRDLNPETLNYDKLDHKFQELWAVKHGWRDYEDIAA